MPVLRWASPGRSHGILHVFVAALRKPRRSTGGSARSILWYQVLHEGHQVARPPCDRQGHASWSALAPRGSGSDRRLAPEAGGSPRARGGDPPLGAASIEEGIGLAVMAGPFLLPLLLPAHTIRPSIAPYDRQQECG